MRIFVGGLSLSTLRSLVPLLWVWLAFIGPQPTELFVAADPPAVVETADTPDKVEAAVSGWFERQQAAAEARFLRALEASDPTPKTEPAASPEVAVEGDVAAADVFDNFAIIGPIEPIKTPQQVTLKVVGLTDAELPQASIDVTPPLDYTPVKTWTGETVILVPITAATKAGKYTVTVSLNAWRLKVDDGLVAARQAQVPQKLLDEYFALATKLKEKYPSKSASCALDVALGPFQPPVVDPNDPQPPFDPNNPTKVTKLVYVYEKDQGNTPRQVAAALNKINADSSLGVVASEFEDDSTDGDGQVPDQYKIALEAARKVGLPALVVESNGMVKRVIKNPRTESEVMQAIAP